MNLTPYTDKGFACAAAGRGITEALREHLNVIVRNEELELEISDSEIQTEIDVLVEDKERLEQLKLDRQENISELTKELAKKDTKLSELNAQLQNPLNAKPTPSPRIEELQSELDEKKVEQGKVETDLEAPTEVELNPSAVEIAQVSANRRLSWVERFLIGLPLTLVVLGLAFYLIIFYASAGDRAFTKGIGTNEEKKQLIIHRAFFEAWNPAGEQTESKAHKNWFVITFPFIFLMLAYLAYLCHEYKNKLLFWMLLGATFLIDFIIAIKIAREMHFFSKGENVPHGWGTVIDTLSVLLLGFGVSVLLGFGLLWIVKIWRGEKAHQDASEQLKQLKRAEQNDRLVQLNGLKTEIQNLETMINTLKQEQENSEKHIEQTFQQQQQVRITRLNTQKEKLQNHINDLNEQVESLQKEINSCETKLEGLFNRQRSKGLDLKKLEANKSEFVTGWCKYVAQRQNELPEDIDKKIKEIHHLADETLEAYKAALPTI